MSIVTKVSIKQSMPIECRSSVDRQETLVSIVLKSVDHQCRSFWKVSIVSVDRFRKCWSFSNVSIVRYLWWSIHSKKATKCGFLSSFVNAENLLKSCSLKIAPLYVKIYSLFWSWEKTDKMRILSVFGNAANPPKSCSLNTLQWTETKTE